MKINNCLKGLRVEAKEDIRVCNASIYDGVAKGIAGTITKIFPEDDAVEVKFDNGVSGFVSCSKVRKYKKKKVEENGDTVNVISFFFTNKSDEHCWNHYRLSTPENTDDVMMAISITGEEGYVTTVGFYNKWSNIWYIREGYTYKPLVIGTDKNTDLVNGGAIQISWKEIPKDKPWKIEDEEEDEDY